jgi:glycosyltransferase involved in cell wall biosynthesis
MPADSIWALTVAAGRNWWRRDDRQPVGANSEIIEHGLNGFLVRSDDEWIAALAELRESPELRARMGAAGRKKVVERYSVQVTAPRLQKVLHEVAAGARSG